MVENGVPRGGSMKIKNIIFDIGNVLVDFCWKKVMSDLGLSEEVIEIMDKKWIGTPIWDELDMGIIPEEESLEHARAALGEKAAYVDLFMANVEKVVVIKPEMFALLHQLHSVGYGIYILSNYPQSLFECHRCYFDFLSDIDGIVVSSDVRMMKPDVEIYRCLLDKYALRAEECLFIDDRPVNVKGAEMAGIQAVCFTDEVQLRKELEQRKIIVRGESL